MKKFLKVLLVMYVLFAPVMLLAQAVTGDAAGVTFTSLFGQVEDGVALAKAGSWLLFVNAVIMFLCDLMKLPALGGLFNRIPPRYRLTIPIVLGGIAGILTGVAGGATWINAVVGAIVYGAGSAAFRQALVKMILGRDLNQAVNGDAIASNPIG